MLTVEDTFAEAWKHHQANEFQRAEQLYKKVLDADASHADAWCFLGAACQAQGKVEEAEEDLRRAINLLPSHASAMNCLGILLAQKGKLGEAAACFQRLLEHQPQDADAHNNLGLVMAQQGRLDEAIACYQKALAIKPDFHAARGNLDMAWQKRQPGANPPTVSAMGQPDMARAANLRGVAFAEQGRFEEARSHFEQALRYQSNDPDALNNLGSLHSIHERHAEAMEKFQQVLRIKPDYTEAHYNLGNVQSKIGKVEEAKASYREAIRLASNHVDAMNNLAIILLEQNQLDEAGKLLRRALQLKPSFADAWTNLGNVLDKQGNLEESRRSYQEAIRLKPECGNACNNLGNAYKQQGQLEDALRCYEQALQRDPNFAEAHFNHALLLLLAGNWSKGWPEYEWRWKTQDFTPVAFHQARWNGEPLAGRTLLLLAEQGIGDTLQFIRYLPLLKAFGGKVIIQCHSSLQRILSECAKVENLVIAGQPLPEFDVYAPLMSLPGILKHASPSDVPADIPYLHADPALVEYWRRELADLKGMKIGVAWQGRPTYRGDRYRSIPFTQFGRLAKIPGVHLISLQKGPAADQIRDVPEGGKVLDVSGRLDETTGAFMDTAAVMMNLDLIISSDTAIPHLAGGLGVPVWVALHLTPDWRWLLQREDSPWYPTMKLFRQQKLAEWDSVFERIANDVESMVATRKVKA